MLIWSTFYRDRANDLANRAGAVGACGIYKITHIDSGLAYVGQARNIKDRWIEHIKCSLGIDTPVTSQLYAFTREKGIENFTFEVLEVCTAADLNEKERTYIDMYQTKDFGLNKTKGNK
jgi:group I intron endonuclease